MRTVPRHSGEAASCVAGMIASTGQLSRNANGLCGALCRIRDADGSYVCNCSSSPEILDRDWLQYTSAHFAVGRTLQSADTPAPIRGPIFTATLIKSWIACRAWCRKRRKLDTCHRCNKPRQAAEDVNTWRTQPAPRPQCFETEYRCREVRWKLHRTPLQKRPGQQSKKPHTLIVSCRQAGAGQASGEASASDT